MATTGAVKGNAILIYVGSSAIACTTDASFDLSMDTITVTCKDNDGAEQVVPGGIKGTFSVSGIWKYDASYGIVDILSVFTNKTKVTIKYSTEVSGDTYLQSDAYITSTSGKAGLNEGATFSVTFTVTGGVTVATVA